MTKPISKTQAAIMTGRTLFPMKVKSINDGMGKTEKVIKKSGNVKLGKRIQKGWAKGFPIYTVTLEERETCPNTCPHWGDCYGNNMPFATRYKTDDAFVPTMALELAELQRKHPNGFMVRLHILGDFYSVDYAAQWGFWLNEFPALHVWGYTHRHKGTAIGDTLANVVAAHGNRFALRWSDDHTETMGAHTMDNPATVEMVDRKEAFICPAQTQENVGCDTCGLCWTAKKSVAFLTH